MKRRYLVFIAVSCVFFLLEGCQQQAKVAEEPSTVVESKKGEPKIEFENLVYDFGKVGPREKLIGEFKFTNTGDAPLKITKVERCCGAVTKLDKEQLAPGESGVLEVRYTSKRTPGKIKKLLYVNSNDEDNPRITLTIQAKVELQVTWEPKSLKLLLKDENAGCPAITLTSTKNQPFSITKFECTGGFITADIDSSIKATEFVLQPKVDMEKLQKSQTGRIRIGLAYPEPNIPPESVTIVFRALARFSTMPSMVRVSYDEPNKPISKHLWIIGNYGEDFEVGSTSSKEGHIKVLSQKKNRNGNSYVLSLEITPPDGETQRFTDVLYVNLKDDEADETLEVTCHGVYSSAKPTKVAQVPAPDASVASGKTAAAATEPDGPAPNVKPILRARTRFKITPQAIVVFAEPHKPVARKISVITNDDEDFEVDSVSSKNGFVKVLRKERIDNGYRFEVEVTAPDPDAAAVKFTDVLYVNVKDAERLSIRIYGRYIKRSSSPEQ